MDDEEEPIGEEDVDEEDEDDDEDIEEVSLGNRLFERIH